MGGSGGLGLTEAFIEGWSRGSRCLIGLRASGVSGFTEFREFRGFGFWGLVVSGVEALGLRVRRALPSGLRAAVFCSGIRARCLPVHQRLGGFGSLLSCLPWKDIDTNMLMLTYTYNRFHFNSMFKTGLSFLGLAFGFVHGFGAFAALPRWRPSASWLRASARVALVACAVSRLCKDSEITGLSSTSQNGSPLTLEQRALTHMNLH